MKNLLKIFIISFVLFISFYLKSYAEIVKTVKVQGNERVSKETIIIYGDIKIGADYEAADINLLCDPGVFFDTLSKLKVNNKWNLSNEWFDLNKTKKQEWVDKTLKDLNKETKEAEANGGKIHPLQLALDVQDAIGEKDWLVIDGGNTHFWSEIAINIAGSKGKKIGGILHPGTFSMLGVGVPFALSAKNTNPNSKVILISGAGAFLSG